MVKRLLVPCALAVLLLFSLASTAYAVGLTPVEQLGKALFHDANLSLNSNQSCATCHAPEVGWTGPHSTINAHGSVYEGSIPGAFGDRKPPAAAYGGNSPILYYDEEEEVWVGGMFWDGRATGDRLGDPLAEQALGPFLNSKEQALGGPAVVVGLAKASYYADLFEAVWGTDVWDDPMAAYDKIGISIAAYERSAEVSPYSAKYDAYLAGKAKLSGAEKRGEKLFFGKAKCSLCHAGPDFTDFTYDNLGLPKNPANPVYDENPTFIDPGLGGFLKAAGYPSEVWMAQLGKHKVPTLRNVDLRPAPQGRFVKAYGHNGYFKSLKEIVHFYNTRDVAKWPAPEVADNVNADELGNLGLSDREEDDVVAFMQTLSDGWKP